ncbi:unnamed protein product [Owenia fusiformis]|uniref:protein-tyrosine-phosphatase n=1 Tax=Owenia fusiformis TaxID=6347 RepID=A0A8S4Q6A5_OWEFU|nr:unnamed protein product [Owenia fusiformis]
MIDVRSKMANVWLFCLLWTLLEFTALIRCQNTSCQQGYFGTNCSDVCHCYYGDTECSTNGTCESGNCTLGWVKPPTCQIELPSLTTAPSIRNVTDDVIILLWKPWNQTSDIGSPPVVRYSVYFQTSHFNTSWVYYAGIPREKDTSTHILAFSRLDRQGEYRFSVVCVWFDNEANVEMNGIFSPATEWVRFQSPSTDDIIINTNLENMTTVPTLTANESLSNTSTITFYDTTVLEASTAASTNTTPGRPLSLKLVARSFSSLTLTWDHPSPVDHNVTRYKIKTELLESILPANPFSEEIIVNASIVNCTVTDLSHATLYQVSVFAYNILGWGQQQIRQYFTDFYPPPKPPVPQIVEGKITSSNFTVILDSASISTGPLTAYRIIVEAIPSLSLEERRMRSASQILEMDKLVDFSSAQSNGVNVYVTAQILPTQLSRKVEIVIGDGKVYDGFFNAPLESLTSYIVYLAYISTLDGQTKSSVSSPSEIITTTAKIIPTTATPALQINNNDYITIIGVLIGIICILVAAIAVGLVIVFVKRNRGRRQNTEHKMAELGQVAQSATGAMNSHKGKNESNGSGIMSNGHTGNSSLGLSTIQLSGIDKVSQKGKMKETSIKIPTTERMVSTKRNSKKAENEHPIDVNDLYEEYMSLQKGGALTKEFKEIPKATDEPITEALRDEKSFKNRFKNKYIPYDKHRVVLDTLNYDPSTDYINASYVRAPGIKRWYIVTQDPLPSTIDDFWRMVWEQNVDTIVMLSDDARGSIYWSEGGVSNYDDITIRLESIETLAHFAIRRFEISNTGSRDKRNLNHCQFKSWTKQGVPYSHVLFADFIAKVQSLKPDKTKGPMLLHCLDSVGKTGVYIASEALLKQGISHSKIDVPRCVQKIRNYRPHLVKSSKQYSFIYDLLFESLYFGVTTLNTNDIKAGIKGLSQINKATNASYLRDQFESLTTFEKILSPRDDAISPRDAPVFDSYTNLEAYIVLPTGRNDFINALRAAYDNKSSCIISMTSSQGITLPEPDNSRQYGIYVVHTISSENVSDKYTIRNLKIKLVNVPKKKFKQIKMYEFSLWSDHIPELESFLELHKQLSLWMHSYPNEGPLIIYGIDTKRALLMPLLTMLFERIKMETSIDIYRCVKYYNSKYEHVIDSWEEYKFLHKAVAEYSKSWKNEAYNSISPLHDGSRKFSIDASSNRRYSLDDDTSDCPKRYSVA